MESTNIKLNIKLMSESIEIEVLKSATILGIKQKIKEKIKVEEGEQRLIYKGKNNI